MFEGRKRFSSSPTRCLLRPPFSLASLQPPSFANLCCRFGRMDERASRVEEDCIEPALMLLQLLLLRARSERAAMTVRLSSVPSAAFFFDERRGRRRRRHKESPRRQHPSRARLRGCDGPALQGRALQAREPPSPHCEKRGDEEESLSERKKQKKGKKVKEILSGIADRHCSSLKS